MRFHPTPPVMPYEPTNRKIAAGAKRLRLDREKLPLFADLIAEQQPSLDELMERRAFAFVQNQIDTRARKAASWREARARYFQLPQPLRAHFLKWWNQSSYPGDGGYFATALTQLERGDLIMHRGELKDRHGVEWEEKTRARFAAMTDAELDALIQTHFSPLFVEWGRDERQKRAEARAEPEAKRRSPASRRRRQARRR